MMRRWMAMACALFACAVVGCASTERSPSESPDEAAPITYEQISSAEAKALMDSETDYIILDVRTDEEFSAGHIEGAILIPDYEIAARAERELTDKHQLILVYCRSGNRSKTASERLVALGYTNVKEFGGIRDWEYGTVK